MEIYPQALKIIFQGIKFPFKYKEAQIWNSLSTILRDIKSKHFLRRNQAIYSTRTRYYLEEA